MKAVVFTLGCKVNECESNSLIAGLIERGYEVSDKLCYADLYIVNTCAVTQEAEKKSRQTASRILKYNKNAKIIYTGCASQKDVSAFINKPNVTVVTGTFGKQRILDLIDKQGSYVFEQGTFYEDLPIPKTLKTRAFIKVQDGCNNFCSYCIIPYLRGRSRSRSPESIINELTAIKPVEVVINGINLSAYNYNGIDLTGLISMLNSFDCRIRLGSLEARVITDEFLTALKGLKNFAPHFHLSLQSGADSVLKSMNRHYTAKEYVEKVDLIRSYFANAGITTDIIVGFPTETEDDFIKTLELVDRVAFSDIHPFIFSKREGTVAYNMQDLNGEVKNARLQTLLEKKANCKNSFIEKHVGSKLDFLFEEVKDGFASGYSGNYLRLYLPEEQAKNVKHKIVTVTAIKPFNDGLLCQIN